MSNNVVTLQIGQCGNQVGFSFFEAMAKELQATKDNSYDENAFDCFFRPGNNNSMIARALLIDMEPKVITQVVNTSNNNGSFLYDTNNIYFKQCGSANNWAFGYNEHGPKIEANVLELLRKEAEHCDSLSGFLMLQSMAGGTGSGVGCFVTQLVRDEFPHCMIMNQIVWPHATGEVIVQNYNALLTLQKLYEHSDGLLVFENDQLDLACKRLLGIPNPSFSDMNRVIANHMSCFCLPCDNLTNGCDYQLLLDPIQQLCCHPAYKLINSRIIPQISNRAKDYSNFIWDGLLKHLYQMMIADSKIEECINWKVNVNDKRWDSVINKSIANLLILRGKDINTINYQQHVQPFLHPKLYSSFIPPQEAMKIFVNRDVGFNGYDKTAFMLSNCQSVINPLNRTIVKAFEMYNCNAYLHHYKRYKVGKEEMTDMFCKVEQILFDYQQI
ncbi:hypothetical protein ABK040_010354 [Willaertia magna]